MAKGWLNIEQRETFLHSPISDSTECSKGGAVYLWIFALEKSRQRLLKLVLQVLTLSMAWAGPRWPG